MSSKVPKTPKRPRRPKIPIEPIHVEELLAGAGMSGFRGVLDPPSTTHLERLAGEVEALSTKRPCESGAPKVEGNLTGCDATARNGWTEMSARVASVVRKVEALAELMKSKTKNCYGKVESSS